MKTMMIFFGVAFVVTAALGVAKVVLVERRLRRGRGLR